MGQIPCLTWRRGNLNASVNYVKIYQSHANGLSKWMSKYSKENGFTPFAHVGCQNLSKSKRMGLHPFSNGMSTKMSSHSLQMVDVKVYYSQRKNGFTTLANGGCKKLS